MPSPASPPPSPRKAFDGASVALASAADEIVVTRTGGVGSIGVVAAHVDRSARDEKDGLKVTHVHAGARKVDFSPHAPLSEEAHATLQASVDHTYAVFVETVAKARGLDPKAVRATEAALYDGEAGIKAGLADRIGTFDDALDALSARMTRGSRSPRSAHLNTERPMPGTDAPAGGNAPVNLDEARAAAKRDAMADATAIVTSCTKAGFPELAGPLLAAGASAEEVERRLDDAHNVRETAAICGVPEMGAELIKAGLPMKDALARIRAAKVASQAGPEVSNKHAGFGAPAGTTTAALWDGALRRAGNTMKGDAR